MRSSRPIKWSFRKLQNGEEEDGQPDGIFVSLERSVSFEENDDNARVGTLAEMKAQLDAAALKFEGYLHCRRLVLLDFYGTDLGEDEVPGLLESIEVPMSVDEVWRTVRDWVSEDDYNVGYEHLYSR